MTRSRSTRHVATLACALLSAAVLVPPALGQAPPPRLLLLLVVDQMRADYLTIFERHWESGLRRLVTDGAVFENAAYPYANTVTCAGHATVATGALPRTHGMVGNGWWDRDRGALVDCSIDTRPEAAHISYGRPVASGNGPHLLEATTIGDELRRQRPGARVVSISLKPDTAVTLAGHGGDVVTWFDGGARSFVTSRAYGEGPSPDLTAFFSTNPLNQELTPTWTLKKSPEAYINADATLGQRPPAGRDGLFPHAIGGPGAPDAGAIGLWMESPASDRYLGRMAASLIEKLALGADAAPDVLAIGFSALDLVGHRFGPDSREIEDVLINLDQTIGDLLGVLDRRVGPSGYVLALTSDHGVAPIPEAAGGGRVMTEDLEERIADVLQSRWGAGRPGAYAVVRSPYVYFAPGVLARVRADEGLWKEVLGAITSHPGVLRVLSAGELAPSSGDPLVRTAALNYFAGRSGDLVIVAKPGWVAGGRNGTAATSHGTPHDYDRRVPVVLFGNGIRATRVAQAASPADIAPTLAHLAGITLPQAEGRVLREALR
jgi:predicted AlkP superfamily pyrophosphatase or phosphodiesterase